MTTLLRFVWDGSQWLPSWTVEKEGSKTVEVVAVDDKRQITAVFAGSLTGDYLPLRLMYNGTMQQCLPTVHFLPKWHIACSQNHWPDQSTTRAYIENTLLPCHWKVERVEAPVWLPCTGEPWQIHWSRGNFGNCIFRSWCAKLTNKSSSFSPLIILLGSTIGCTKDQHQGDLHYCYRKKSTCCCPQKASIQENRSDEWQKWRCALAEWSQRCQGKNPGGRQKMSALAD